MGCENMIFQNMNMRQVVICHPLIEKTRAKHATFSILAFVQIPDVFETQRNRHKKLTAGSRQAYRPSRVVQRRPIGLPTPHTTINDYRVRKNASGAFQAHPPY